jgi:hypothetical protein
MGNDFVILQPFWTIELEEKFYWPGGVIGKLPQWARCYLNGVLIPGSSKVDCSTSTDVDKKKSDGLHFATLTVKGYNPCDVTIEVTLWTPQQWIDWQTYVWPILKPEPGKKYAKTPKAIAITHPVTASHDVALVTIDTVKGPTVGHSPDIRVFSVKASQVGKWKENATATADGIVIPNTNPRSALKQKPSASPIPAKKGHT